VLALIAGLGAMVLQTFTNYSGRGLETRN